MEIALLPNNSLKIKGKNATILVDPKDKTEANAALIFSGNSKEANTNNVEVVIDGPGEFETGGIKITGQRFEDEMLYSLSVDSVSILIGKSAVLEKAHQKLKEANILVVKCEEVSEASSLTSLVTNVVIFYGENASEMGKTFGQENVKHLSKYASTIDKLPAEVETIILE
ncbi:MAG TPA: hypothetical protein VM077_04085 [Candidatus Limnocylindrales bacterium]|nr:hypothetical protein [Candidatus Limnocylindrales bacterium]